MNLYHLRYFATLAHLEHYTKAAENSCHHSAKSESMLLHLLKRN